MKKLIKIIIGLLIICILGSIIYVSNYYHANEEAESILEEANIELIDDYIVVNAEDSYAGFIFYPGGKVEPTSYLPLMKALSKEGITCIICRMPANLAFMNMDAADGVQKLFPEIQSWYIGGHSLGGVAAGSYLENHVDEYNGLILLASYITNDLSDTNLKCLTVYGSNDEIISISSYNENKKNLPVYSFETEIEGGCHAYFGDYGPQDGDGTPTITMEEQIEQTVYTIESFIRM